MPWSRIAFNRAFCQLAITIGFATGQAGAQVVSGTVTDSGGIPVVGATVAFIEQESDGGTHFATTDDAGIYRIDFARATAIDYSSALPTTTRLLPNYPNPFNPVTLIPYRLAHAGPVELTIYNVLGQPIRTLVSGVREAGEHASRWDGRTHGGHGAATGIYFANLKTTDAVDVGKMVLLDGARGPGPIESESFPARKPTAAEQLGDKVFAVEISSGDLLLFRQRGLSLAAGDVLDFQVPRLKAQVILDGNFRIRSGEQLNEFLRLTRNQPFRVGGSLSIGRLNLADLAPLANLESVGGNLSFFGNGSLESLAGLENLRSVGGRLRV